MRCWYQPIISSRQAPTRVSSAVLSNATDTGAPRSCSAGNRLVPGAEAEDPGAGVDQPAKIEVDMAAPVHGDPALFWPLLLVVDTGDTTPVLALQPSTLTAVSGAKPAAAEAPAQVAPVEAPAEEIASPATTEAEAPAVPAEVAAAPAPAEDAVFTEAPAAEAADEAPVETTNAPVADTDVGTRPFMPRRLSFSVNVGSCAKELKSPTLPLTAQRTLPPWRT